MWNLRKGRGTFLSRYNFKTDRSYWWHLREQIAQQLPEGQSLPEDVAETDAKWLNWPPTNSNCPNLAAAVDDVVRMLPQEWKATGKSVFVGIAPKGEINAAAWVHQQGGIVEINIQYLWALESYVLAFDEYRHAVQREVDAAQRAPHLAHADPSYGDLVVSWAKLDRASEEWRDPAVLAPGNTDVVRIPPGRTTLEVSTAVRAAQAFVVSHELAHHLMAHTSSHGAKKRAERAREFIAPLLAADEQRGHAALPASWRHEVEADLVALAILCGKFTGQPAAPPGHGYGYSYGAIGGAFAALLCATHGEDLEYADPGDSENTHPPLSLRLAFLGRAIRDWYGEAPRGAHNDHPIDMLNQYEVFVDIFVAYQTGELPRGSDPETTIALVLAKTIDRFFALAEQIPLRKDAVGLPSPEHRVLGARYGVGAGSR